VLVAPDEQHLALSLSSAGSTGATFVLSKAPPRRGFRPSADVLFASLAETCGANAVGVVLSGIGDDGAEGLLAMRKMGATTLAQDEASCAVFGMPRAARDNGGAAQLLALEDIPAALVRRVRQLARPTSFL
jgi:two-component system chemotaxis response regulator CheB